MNALKDESVQFKAGWNAARTDHSLSRNASEDARSGYEAYFLEYMPKPPQLRTSEGYNSELAKSKRKFISEQTYLKRLAKNGIK